MHDEALTISHIVRIIRAKQYVFRTVRLDCERTAEC